MSYIPMKNFNAVKCRVTIEGWGMRLLRGFAQTTAYLMSSDILSMKKQSGFYGDLYFKEILGELD